MLKNNFNMGNLNSIRLTFHDGSGNVTLVVVHVDLTGVSFDCNGPFWLLGSDLQLIAKCQHVLKHQDTPQ